MSGELAVVELSVGTFLDKAIAAGTDADSLAKLVDLYERVQARSAESAFNEAMQQFQSRCPAIGKNRDGAKARYADLEHITNVIRPLLKKLRLSYSFDSKLLDKVVKVRCTIHHGDGHSRPSTFSAPIDSQARAMNVTQQAASALSYGKRYALCMALGITTGDNDDDGEGAGRAQSEAPTSRGDASQSQPRGRRVDINDLNTLASAWQSHVAYDKDDAEEFSEWIFRTCGMPKEKRKDWREWSIEQLRTCYAAIDLHRGAPPSTEGKSEIPY